jgi:hypothetical protein
MQPYSSLDFADFNGDQQLDMVAGGFGGGLMFFEGTSSDAVLESEFLPDLNVFPNPTNGKFSVTCNQPITGLRCCNALGQEVKRISCSPSSRLSIDLVDLPGGWLLVMVETSSGIIHRTLWHQP